MTHTNETHSDTSSATWNAYCLAGRQRAMQLGNRGPMRFGKDGRLSQQILAAYRRTGFYVFTGLFAHVEVAELTSEFDQVLDNAPISREGGFDRFGRPVKFPGYYRLSTEPQRADGQASTEVDARAVVALVSHPLMMMDSALRLYGHPQILKMVESVNGEDFVPFHETVFHKGAKEGPPTPWHQDGRTHWTVDGESLEQPDGSGKTHGFNLSVPLSPCTPENCLWVVPGSQRRWLLANGGTFPPITERLAEAVPMILAPGDCGMVNRSALHGSFPNRSSDRRVTIVIGFHKRDSVIGAETTNIHAFKLPGKATKAIKYSEDYVLRRTRMIPLAVDARRQRYPDETPYVYKGHYAGEIVWNEQTREEIGREGDEYWQRDITL